MPLTCSQSLPPHRNVLPASRQAPTQSNSNAASHADASYHHPVQTDPTFDHYAELAKRKGDLSAMLKCGEALLHGLLGVERNTAMAINYFFKIVDSWSNFCGTEIKGQAWVYLGEIAARGSIALRDGLDELRCYQSAAECNSQVGALRAGYLYLRKCASLAATGNESIGLFDLWNGNDPRLCAYKFFKIAADLGSLDASYCLGVMNACNKSRLEFVSTKMIDDGQAIFPSAQIMPESFINNKHADLVTAARGGHFGANFQLGKYRLKIAFETKNFGHLDIAAGHFSFARQSTDPNAWAYVGKAYMDQLLTMKADQVRYPVGQFGDYLQLLREWALESYETAKTKNSSLAYEQLGLIFEKTDPARAIGYYEKAMDLGSPRARNFLRELNNRLASQNFPLSPVYRPRTSDYALPAYTPRTSDYALPAYTPGTSDYALPAYTPRTSDDALPAYTPGASGDALPAYTSGSSNNAPPPYTPTLPDCAPPPYSQN